MIGKSVPTMLLALSILLLSVSIFYFAVILNRVNEELPRAISIVEKANLQVERALVEIQEVRALVPLLQHELDETRRHIPPILQEVALIRNEVPTILQDVNAFRQQLAIASEEVTKIREQVPDILNETAKIRTLVPKVLVEVQKTREAAPQVLSKIERIVEDTNQIGKTTTEGAVTGVVTGVLKTPFRLISNFGSAIFGIADSDEEEITESDVEIIKQATYRLLATANRGESLNWSNPESGNSGSITIKKRDTQIKRVCRVLNYTIELEQKKGTKKDIDKDVKFCLDNEDNWQHTPV